MDVLEETLHRYDRRIAAGILARAAIAVETGQEYRKPIVENERDLQLALIAEARAKLGIRADDNRPEVVNKIGAFLDDASERVSKKPDDASAIERLVERGDLPSDLYEIKIGSNVRDFFGKKFEREKELIEVTVRRPSKEQHFGVQRDPNAPRLVSLFARDFKTPYPAKNFTLLVVGQRGKGRILNVFMAWRVYPSVVDVSGATDLIDMLRRFAEVYGVDFKLGEERGKFFLTTSQNVPKTVQVIGSPRGAKRTITLTHFFQHNSATQVVNSLVMAIDLTLYRKTLDRLDTDQISEGDHLGASR